MCLISAVEPCYSFQVRKRMATDRLEIFRRERACLHHYLYLIDPEFGFMHIRIQGWLPYVVQLYINGRGGWPIDKAGVGYVRYENSLVAIDDLEVASRLCDHFAHRAWPRLLNAFAKMVNPLMGKINAAGYGGYYWVLDQGEIATDVMFKTRPALLSSGPTSCVTPPSSCPPKTCSAFSVESSTPPWLPRWSPTPSADPRVGGCATVWPATG